MYRDGVIQFKVSPAKTPTIDLTHNGIGSSCSTVCNTEATTNKYVYSLYILEYVNLPIINLKVSWNDDGF